jgi:hypothetical protein
MAGYFIDLAILLAQASIPTLHGTTETRTYGRTPDDYERTVASPQGLVNATAFQGRMSTIQMLGVARCALVHNRDGQCV